MERPFYRSLDREIQVLGLKGKWLRIFLILFALGAVLAFLFGASSSTGIGIIVFLIVGVASFLGCLVLQGKMPSRRVDKFKIASKCSLRVVRRESLGRILTRSSVYEEAQRLLSQKNNS